MTKRLFMATAVTLIGMLLATPGCSGGKSPGLSDIEIEIDGKPFAPHTGEVKVDIGAIPVGSTRTFNITVYNTGQGKILGLLNIVMDYSPQNQDEGPGAEDMGFYLRNLPSLPAEVAPTNEGTDTVPEFETFQVVFKRFDDVLPRSAVVTVLNDNSKDSDKQNLTITFGTRDCNPSLSAPSQVDFGQVQKETLRDINISNTGSCELIIDGFIFTGHTDYTLIAEETEYTADLSSEKVLFDPALVIPSNSSVTWQTRYSPDSGDPAQADLFVFATNDEEALDGRRIELLANTSGPCIKVTPSPVDFGGELIGQTAKIDVEIKSCGTGPLIISDIVLQRKDDEHPDWFDSSLDFSLGYDKLPGGVRPSNADPLEVGVNDSVQFTVQCTPDQQNPLDPVTGKPLKDEGVIQIDNNTFDAKLPIQTICFGVLEECPQPVILITEGEEVPPQTLLHLDGSQSEASSGAIVSYQWSLEQPDDNKFNLVPTYNFPDPTHEVNVAGTYTYCLDVCDAQFCSNDPECNTTACKKVVVVPDQAIHVELTWDTPADADPFDEGPDAGSDMDIHFTHPFATGPDIDLDGKPDPWFDLTYDCFWYNPVPGWESMSPNVEDDPSLDRDDTDGAGPENINLDIPKDGRVYKVGVHYWDDHGYGASFPTVRIWIYSEMKLEVSLKDEDINLIKGDMWEVAHIEWDSTATILPVKTESGGHKITHDYVNPAFEQISGGN
ncbi:MAG: hypothetical protein ISR64_11035 [Deltaproteobacteria bacterium]|nr:hypothetical protein [Deltaproteobacteria bacterium]